MTKKRDYFWWIIVGLYDCSACFEPIILDDDSEAESDFWIKNIYQEERKMRALDFFRGLAHRAKEKRKDIYKQRN